MGIFLLTLRLAHTCSWAFTVIDSDPNRLPTRAGVVLFPSYNHIVRDSSGKIYVAYTLATNQSTHYYNYIRWSSDGGGTWSNAVRTETMPDSSTTQSLVIDPSGNLYEGFTFNVGSFFTKSTDGGQTWSDAMALYDGGWGAWDYHPSIVMDSNGTLHAAYFAGFGWNDPPYNVMYKQSTDNGTTWSSGVDLTNIPNDSSIQGAQSPNMYAGPDGHLFIIYTYYSNESAPYLITKMLLHFDGTEWSQPIPLSESGISGLYGDLAVDSSGILHTVYPEKNAATGNYQLTYRTYDPVNKTLSNPRKITPDTVKAWNATMGIYSNDKIVIAYDTYDESTQKYGGVYVRTSEDGFAAAHKISTHPEARYPNLRSALNMNHPDMIDIVWIEPNDASGGEDLVYNELSQGIVEPKKLLVSAWGPKIANPGQEIAFLVQYRNTLDTVAENVVVSLDIPRQFNYLSSTGNGIYRNDADRHEVFWKLGNLQPGTRGNLVVRMNVPWGLPTGNLDIFAQIGASNVTSNIDIDFYSNYSQPTIVSQQDLSETEVDTLLSTNQKANDLLQYALKLGYFFNKQGTRTNLSDGSYTISLFLLDLDDFSSVMLITDGTEAVLEKYNGREYSRFDDKGGYTLNSSDGTSSSWGEWAETHSLSMTNCMWNCIIEKDPVGLGGNILKTAWNTAGGGINCWLCKTTGGAFRCASCLNNVIGLVRTIKDPRNKAITRCANDCNNNTDSHKCAAPMGWCGLIEKATIAGLPKEMAFRRSCTDGVYDLIPSTTPCTGSAQGRPQRCVNGECKELDLEQCIMYSYETMGIMDLGLDELLPIFSDTSGMCSLDELTVEPAHDPNAKFVDFKGDVIPGQKLTYTVEFENEGAGTAYEVFIVDTLDKSLDETTLVFLGEKKGVYDAASRVLSWEIGTLPPCTEENPDVCKGSVSFSVNVKNGLASGTEIVNYAEVHFPSAAEITPTNPVLNMVKTIAADPKTVETLSEAPVSITLTGSDSGSAPLTYKLTSDPLFGTITGTPPKLTYTSMDEFSGQDEFYYVVSNGTIDSDPAKVIVKVDPNPADKNPPTVISTYPQNDAADVQVNNTPLSDDPVRYAPTLSATFSEPLDGATVTAATFTVDGLTGNVYYDEQLKTAYFAPSVALLPSETYTARLSTGIRDKIGNAMTEYVWSFTTQSPANIAVILPDQTEILDFGEAQIGSSATEKVVNVMNTGTDILYLGSITVSGANSDEFKIIEDKCSLMALGHLQNCTVRLSFVPAASGVRTALLSVPSNDADTPTLETSMTGKGIVPIASYDLSLSGGWNLISLPVLPPDTSVGVVLASVSYTVVWGYQNGWKMYDPNHPMLSDLTNFSPGYGYWILVKQPGPLHLEGEVLSKTVPLTTGWNLAGYNALTAQPAADALASINEDLVSAWAFTNENWQLFNPGNPGGNNSLTNMEPGYGYWIEMKKGRDWTLP